ncbi:hypothetical protein FA95DRAFT_1608991 [Auriscalpium vulgare]|uniref:Uncharacterized protein n=1 Tax=Auriscalpium vulgare TaxID=40419 RepID=A0ACB8RK01_9AGAM|nr:hypothetical protein FA95DRAFT_1608991 [Auriscalpium vulgare]
MAGSAGKRKDLSSIVGQELPTSVKRPRVDNAEDVHNSAADAVSDSNSTETMPEDPPEDISKPTSVNLASLYAPPEQNGQPSSESTSADDYQFDLGDIAIPPRPYINARLISRLKAMIGYENDADNTYSSVRLPNRLVWGPPGTAQANNLCKPQTAIPVIVWHVGEVTNLWFFTRNGDPADNVSVTVKPLTSVGQAAVQRIMQRYSDPARRNSLDFSAVEVKASCWQSVRVPGQKAAVAKHYDRFYNATSRFERKADMVLLDVANLKRGDIVLLETYISRYVDKQDKLPRLTHTLCAVSLLCSGYPTASVDKDDERFQGSL